jgi:hypothetical protein
MTCHVFRVGPKTRVRVRQFGVWCRMARRRAATEGARMSDQDGRPWESGGDLPWDTPETECDGECESWRGELHLDDWPENLAGPEYWLYKRQRDE